MLARSRYHLIGGYWLLARNYLAEAKEPLLHPALVRIRHHARPARGRHGAQSA